MQLYKFSAILLAAITLSLSGCGGGSTSPQGGGSAGTAGGGNNAGGNNGGGDGGQDPDQRKMTVVVLAIDSLMPEDIDSAAMPNVSSLITNGTLYEESRSVFSAETIPNHVAMVTGVYPDRNGIPTNNFIDREAFATALAADSSATADGEDLDNPNELTAKTLFTWIDEKCRTGAIPRNADISTAAVLSKLYLHAVFEGDDIDPQTNDAGINNVIPDFHFDPETDDQGAPRAGYIGPGSEHALDTTTGPAAVSALADADFIFINLGDVDRSAHVSGQSGRQAARTTADSQVGTIITELMNTGRWDDTVLIISSDHGMDFSVNDDPNNTVADGEAEFTDPQFSDLQLAVGSAGNIALNSLSTQSTILNPLAEDTCGLEELVAVQNGGTNSIVATSPTASVADKAAALHAARSCLLNFDDDSDLSTATCTDALSAALNSDTTAVAACKATLSKPANVDKIEHAWYANPLFYSGNNLITELNMVEANAIMPSTIKSRHENIGDLVLVIGDGYKFSEPDASGNPIPGNHGHMPTIHNTIIVSGGSSILVTGNTVNGTSTDHFARAPTQSENIDVAATVAWLLGLNIQDSDFPDAGDTFPDYGDNVTRAGFDGRVLSEAFNVDPLVTTPSDCGVIN